MSGEIIQITITGVFSMGVALGTIWLKHQLEMRKNKKDQESYERISASDVDSMVEVQNYLSSFREKWNLDRIGVFQFHNGGKFFHGVPMKKYSQTFESTSPGISRTKEYNQNVFVTEHPSLIKHLNEKEMFCVDAEDPVLDYIREKVHKEGVLQIISAPIRCLSGQLIGFIQVHTVKERIKECPELAEDLLDLASHLSGYIVSRG
jgi:hypothetical protein